MYKTIAQSFINHCRCGIFEEKRKKEKNVSLIFNSVVTVAIVAAATTETIVIAAADVRNKTTLRTHNSSSSSSSRRATILRVVPVHLEDFMTSCKEWHLNQPAIRTRAILRFGQEHRGRRHGLRQHNTSLHALDTPTVYNKYWVFVTVSRDHFSVSKRKKLQYQLKNKIKIKK